MATYAYCVVRSDRSPDLRRAPPGMPGARRPRAVDAGRPLWLIVADAPLSRYGEAALARVIRDLNAVSACAVAHSAVVAHCARRNPALPLRLLTLFANDRRALDQLRRRRRLLEHRLTRVAGRAEWGIQVRLEQPTGGRVRRTRAAARQATAGLSPGTRFLEMRRRERHGSRELTAGAQASAASLYRALARQADGARRRPAVSPDGQPALLLDAAFLVPMARTAEFRRAVREQAARVRDRGLRLRLTGPWPAYSFVTGRL
jgi:hypothetical protein